MFNALPLLLIVGAFFAWNMVFGTFEGTITSEKCKNYIGEGNCTWIVGGRTVVLRTGSSTEYINKPAKTRGFEHRDGNSIGHTARVHGTLTGFNTYELSGPDDYIEIIHDQD